VTGLLWLSACSSVLAINPPSHDTPRAARVIPQGQRILSMNWEQLLPPQEREHFSLVPPPAIHDYLAETAPATAQSGSAAVNPALEGVAVQLIGFIVPIELTPSGSVIRSDARTGAREWVGRGCLERYGS